MADERVAGGVELVDVRHDASGNRDNSAERTLSVSSVRGLHVRWRSPLGPVYGTPAVVDDAVYAADVYGGYLGYGDIANLAAENPVKGGVVALGF